MSMKNPLTPAGIEPATFRFIAQHLNHCATAVPPSDKGTAIPLQAWTGPEVYSRLRIPDFKTFGT